MSIAEKHLSKYGRFGDTEMYRTTKTGPGKGELWHVNPQEKSLMDMYGQRGEKLVDLIGSGTINPITGKEEKWVQLALMGVQAGLSLYQGYKGTKSQRDQARDQMKLIDKQKTALDESEVKLAESVGAQRQLITQEAERELGQVSEVTGKKLQSVLEQTEKVSSKTGFAYSGQVEEIQDEATSDIRESFDYAEEGMMGQYGKALGEISGMYEEEKSRIKAERDRLESERKLAKTQSKRKFLGIF
tara:strand:- start:13942 stop:14673 length:732 start_codon:yes stop_codon:yes gene_type:complete